MLILNAEYNQKGVSNRDRFNQKSLIVVEWLSLFGYSIIPILLRRMGLKNKNFFARMRKHNLIDQSKCDVISHNIVLLTPTGFVTASENFEHCTGYRFDASKINQSLIKHDLSVQICLMNRLNTIEKFIPERMIREGQKGKIPDAIFVKDGVRYALEVERTHKSIPRVYRTFIEHVKAFKSGHIYEAVEYVFPTESLKSRYEDLFEKPEWPLYEYSEKRRRYVRKINIHESDGLARFRPQINTKNRFKFLVEEML